MSKSRKRRTAIQWPADVAACMVSACPERGTCRRYQAGAHRAIRKRDRQVFIAVSVVAELPCSAYMPTQGERHAEVPQDQ